MTKVLCIGRMGCNQRNILPFVSEAAKEHDVSDVVLLGNYADVHKAADKPDSFLVDCLSYQVSWFKTQCSAPVHFVIGKWDWLYLSNVYCDDFKGYRNSAKQQVRSLLKELNPCLAFEKNGTLFTHAGVQIDWAKQNNVSVCNASEASKSLNDMLFKSKLLPPDLNCKTEKETRKAVPSPLECTSSYLCSTLKKPHVDYDQIVSFALNTPAIADVYSDGYTCTYVDSAPCKSKNAHALLVSWDSKGCKTLNVLTSNSFTTQSPQAEIGAA